MLGILPREIYDLIADQLADHRRRRWWSGWENQDLVTWAGVCRAFRQDVRQRISRRISIGISGDEQDVFDLVRLRRLLTGPAPLLDTTKTKEFIIHDNRFDQIWDPIGDELNCWNLCHEGVYGDSFLKLLPGGERIEEPTEEQCERGWKLAIEVFCNLFSNMLNLEILEWGATVPIADAYEGHMPLCGALPGSKTIVAQWMRFHKLQVLKLNDRQITDPRFLLYMDTPELNLLEIGSRLYCGSAEIRGGLEHVKMTEHQIKEINLFGEVENQMDQELYTFLSKCRKLTKVKVESFDPLQNADCLPFWSTIDVEIESWHLKARSPRSLEGERDDWVREQYEVARAVRSFRPHMLRSKAKISPLSIDDLHQVLRTYVRQEFDGIVYDIDLFAPFREWIRTDRNLAERVVSHFNDHRHLVSG